MSMPEREDLELLCFIAHSMYVVDCQMRNEIPVVWLCLRTELQSRYLEMASRIYLGWVKHEIAYKAARANGTLGAFFVGS